VALLALPAWNNTLALQRLIDAANPRATCHFLSIDRLGAKLAEAQGEDVDGVVAGLNEISGI
jgi:hypothetical protein